MSKGPFDPIMTGLEMLADVEKFLSGDSRRSVEIAMTGSPWAITITDVDPRQPIYGGGGFPPRAMRYRGDARTAADAWMAAVREWRADHPEGR